MVIYVLPYVINIREVHGLSAFEVQMAIKKLKRYKSPGIDQIPAELIILGQNLFFRRSLNLLNLFGK